MAMIDATKAAERWSQGMAGASTKYIEGIQSTTVNPMELAAANAQGYLNGVQEAVNSGKWAAGLRRNPVSYWKDQAIKVGATRLSSGATAAKPKVQAFYSQFLPFLQSQVERIRALPASTFEERKARAMAMMDAVHQFRRS